MDSHTTDRLLDSLDGLTLAQRLWAGEERACGPPHIQSRLGLLGFVGQLRVESPFPGVSGVSEREHARHHAGSRQAQWNGGVSPTHLA